MNLAPIGLISAVSLLPLFACPNALPSWGLGWITRRSAWLHPAPPGGQ